MRALKKKGFVSLIAVMIGVTTLTGCSGSADDWYNDEKGILDKCYQIIDDKYIEINGVLHYGDVYNVSSLYALAKTEMKYYKLADGTNFLSNKEIQYFIDDKKPDKDGGFYTRECEECMKHANYK